MLAYSGSDEDLLADTSSNGVLVEQGAMSVREFNSLGEKRPNSNSSSANRTNSNSHELELEKLEEKCW